MTQQDLIALSEVSLFNNVDILDLEHFFKDFSVQTQTYDDAQLIAQQGELYIELIFILHGKAAASMTAPNGKVVRLETLQGPCAAASAVLFSSQKALPVTLHSIQSSQILRIPEDTIVTLMQSFPAFLRAYLRENGDKLLFLAEKIRLFQFKSLKQKLIGHFLMLAARQERDEIEMVYSREDLSQLMGVARPSLSREFSNLVNAGLIEAKGKKVRFINKAGLMKMLQEE